MITVVRNVDQALNFLFDAWNHKNESLIFDILEGLDLTDIPVSLCQCKTCDVTMHFCLEDDPDFETHECPRCREIGIEEVAVAGLVIQGAVVLSTNWR